MRNRFAGWILAGAAALAFSPALTAQTAPPSGASTAKPAPRTPEGKPDLSGIWQREGGFGFRVVGEAPAMLPWAAARYNASRRGSRTPQERATDEYDPNSYPYCLSKGFPRVYDGPHPFEIVQRPDRVYMQFETDNQSRRIYLDGRKHSEGLPATFMGHSVGRWDGDTLVAETVGLNDLTWIDGLGRPHSDALRVEERLRRLNHDLLEVVLRFDDPKTYARPWTGRMTFPLRPNFEMMENVICEDNSGEAWREAVRAIKAP